MKNSKKHLPQKRLLLDFYPSESALIEQVEKQPRKQTYIKALIRKDLVMHGRWVKADSPGTAASICDDAICSCCKGEALPAPNGLAYLVDFCPHCGAHMDE
ncbi:MAG: hypothetical protein IJ459_04540 [Clostridia bacterium]|nr:hypothetical protein [Clostridia bacterium]